MIDKRDKAFRENRHHEAYGKPMHTDDEVQANYLASFKPESEWACNDVVEIVTASKERESGVITGPVEDGRVMILFDDGIHWSYEAIRCHVRRSDQ